MSDRDASEDVKHVTSTSVGGESATFDQDGKKASNRSRDNDDLTKIANRRVRPYFQAVRMFRLPGW